MEYSVSNIIVYGLERAVKASGNPMRVKIDTGAPSEKDYLRAERLGATRNGLGHDNYLKGIVVHMDVVAPLYWWKEAQRYHWFDFVSSESTMHCLLKFDISSQCVEEVDNAILARMKELVAQYNAISDEEAERKKAMWRVLVASLPSGFCLGATMVTTYQQLKTMYIQRHNHRLKEWHVFCDALRQLPHFLEFTGVDRLTGNE